MYHCKGPADLLEHVNLYGSDMPVLTAGAIGYHLSHQALMQRVERQTLGVGTPQVYPQDSHADGTGHVPHFFQTGYQEVRHGGRPQIGGLYLNPRPSAV